MPSKVRIVIHEGEGGYNLNDFTNWDLFVRCLLATVLVWLDHFFWAIVNFFVLGALVIFSFFVCLPCDWWRLGLVELARRYLPEPDAVRLQAAAFRARLANACLIVLAIPKSRFERLKAAIRSLPAAMVAVSKNETRKWPPPRSGRLSEGVPLSAVNSETPNIHSAYCRRTLDDQMFDQLFDDDGDDTQVFHGRDDVHANPHDDFTSIDLEKEEFDLGNAIFFLHLAALVYEDHETLAPILKQWHLKWAAVHVSEGSTCSTAWVIYHSASGHGQDLIVVVFKGTSPFDCVDWLTDLTMSKLKPHGESLPGMVHEGFVKVFEWPWYRKPIPDEYTPRVLNATEGIVCDEEEIARRLGKYRERETEEPFNPPRTFYELLVSEINRTVREQFIEKGTDAALWITGHSLGAALASIFFSHLLHVPELPVIWLKGGYTFGAPRTGDARYADEVRRHPATRHFYDIHNANDLVPFFPLASQNLIFQDGRALTNFSNVGREVVLNYWGTWATVEDADGRRRWKVPFEEDFTCANWGSRYLSLPCYLLRRELPWLATVARCVIFFWPLPWSVFDHLPSEYLRHLELCKNREENTTTQTRHARGSAAHG